VRANKNLMPYDVLPWKKLIKAERTLDAEGVFYNLINWEEVIPNVPDIIGWNVYVSYNLNDWTKLTPTPITVAFYRHRITLQKGYLYYKVTYISSSRGEEPLGDVQAVSELDEDIDGFDGRLKWITLEQLRRLNILLAQKGEPCYLLIRKRYGQTCPHCHDNWAGTSTQEDCPICFGTGFEGGYDIFEGRFHLAAGDERIAETEMGWNITMTPRGWITDYPIIREGCILVRKGDFQRYWLQSISRQVQQSKLLLQIFNMALIEETHPIYRFVLP